MLDLAALATSIKEQGVKTEEMVKAAYEAGFVAGKHQADRDLRSKLFKALDAEQPRLEVPSDRLATVSDSSEDAASGAPEHERAPRGSVEPKVMNALQYSVKGKKVAEIAAETGVPENSVRGKLNSLRKNGLVFKVGEVWRPAGPVVQPDGSILEVQPNGILSFGDKPTPRNAETFGKP